MAYSGPNIQIRITNMPQIRAAFSKAPYLMITQLARDMKQVLGDIKAVAYPRTPIKTGALRGSYYTKVTSPYRATELQAEIGTGVPGNSNVYYDIYVHEGTRYMRARPYLYDAVEEQAFHAEEIFKRGVQTVLDKIAAGTRI